MIVVLSLQIDNQPDRLPGGGSHRCEAHVVDNGSLVNGAVLGTHPVNTGRFIRVNRFLAHLGRPFNVPLRDFLHAAVPVFLQTAFHNPRKDFSL